MNYKAHLQSVFGSEELSDEFFTLLMKQLNQITVNGSHKIDKVTKIHDGCLSVKVPEHRIVGAIIPRQSYYIKTDKVDNI